VSDSGINSTKVDNVLFMLYFCCFWLQVQRGSRHIQQLVQWSTRALSSGIELNTHAWCRN